LGSRETTHRLCPRSPRLWVNLHRRESLGYGAFCANCRLCSGTVQVTDLRSIFRPTQRSVQAWKARIAIHSFTETSPADLITSSLPSDLCYSCQTTLTSRSSRSTAPAPVSSNITSAMNLPTWAAARLASESGMGDEQRADLLASTRANEIWETKKLDDMKSLVGEFFLDK
jgi:hypothetical protein